MYLAGFPLGLLLRAVDPPRVVGVLLAALWTVALAGSAGAWLTHAVRDGALARALPDYLYGALSLALIAVGCAATALIALMVAGAGVTVERVTGWAAIGTFAVLVVYWLVSASR